MSEDILYTKVSLEFAVRTNEKNINSVTDCLGLNPTRFFNKGDIVNIKGVAKSRIRPYGIWAIHKEELSINPDISKGLNFFCEIFSNKKDELYALRQNQEFELLFQLRISTEDVGFGFDLNCKQLKFLSEIVDRFSCFFNVVERLK